MKSLIFLYKFPVGETLACNGFCRQVSSPACEDFELFSLQVNPPIKLASYAFFDNFIIFQRLMALEHTSLHNEKALLLRVAEGDEIAFRMLYDHYRKKIYALGLFLTKSEGPAQELVQDVFLKIWEKREQLREIHYFNAWLRTIARNTAINYLRARAMEKLGIDHLRMHESSSSFTENDVADREYALLLQAAVRQLPPQQQKVYMLHRQQGLCHEAIAEQLDISVLTSKKYMKLALRSIRIFLAGRMDAAVSLAVVACLS